MANTIITKNSATATAVPTAGQLVQGELAVNVTDKRLFTENSGGTVVEVGTNPSTIAVAGNATVGGTLGVTGLATLASSTLTANPTLSSGTANGVTYLNGSKVLTSGSALTFDGTTFGVNNGVAGGAALSLTGTYTGAGSVAFLNFQRVGGAVAGTLGYNDANNSIQFGTTTNHSTIFLQNNAEAMRLTSTGLGIGTSSPISKLTVLGAGTINAPETTTTGGSIQTASYGITTRTGNLELGATDALAANIGGSLSFSARYSGTNATWVTGKIGAYRDTATSGVASSYLAFATTTGAGDLTERLRLDSSGNLGLGVTPSAWRTAYETRAIQVGPVASIFSLSASETNNYAGFKYNNYQQSDGNNIYLKSNFATEYRQANGAHQWLNAPSGTAGGTISFTQAMTTTGSIGDGKLQVSATGTGAGAANTVIGLNVFEETSGNKAGLWFGTMTNSNVGVIGSRTASGSIAFQTYNGGWGERARIMSDGNLQVSSNGTPDTTTTNSGINVNGYYGVLGLNHSGNDYSIVNIHTSGGNNKLFEWRWANSSVGSISTNGSSTSYNTTSDYRLKENWVAVADASTRVNALNPVNFAWKADGSRVDGFLAHELAEVVPEAVTGTKDATEMVDIKDEEGNVTGQEERPVYQGIDQSKLVPLLTAALQEALAEINSLKARLDAANL
jgi:hypothetical protein